MKIKIDFVTNSSSTSYITIICIPKNFNAEKYLKIRERMNVGLDFVNQDELEERAEEADMSEQDLRAEIIEFIKDNLTDLNQINDLTTSTDGGDVIETFKYDALTSFCNELGITILNTSVEGYSNNIILVPEEKFVNHLKKEIYHED